MAARFIYLKNEGSPTRWDGTRYFAYLDTIRHSLPEDLVSLTDRGRYELPSYSKSSLWHADITQLEIARDQIRVSATNDYRTRRFEFIYAGVKKVVYMRVKFRAMPSVVVQELVVMPNGLFRHTCSDLGGDCTTVYASSLSFNESHIQ